MASYNETRFAEWIQHIIEFVREIRVCPLQSPWKIKMENKYLQSFEKGI